jgi:hypothetical protein
MRATVAESILERNPYLKNIPLLFKSPGLPGAKRERPELRQDRRRQAEPVVRVPQGSSPHR